MRRRARSRSSPTRRTTSSTTAIWSRTSGSRAWCPRQRNAKAESRVEVPMPRIHTSRSVLLAAVAALALTAFPRAFQSSAGADHTAHLKAWDAHKTMTQSSPYRSMNWTYVGPTNVSGRTADVAAADHGTSRRLYAGTCCGGLWASDDLGETWQAVFDKEASTSIGAVAVAPSNPDVVWVGTGESNIF